MHCRLLFSRTHFTLAPAGPKIKVTLAKVSSSDCPTETSLCMDQQYLGNRGVSLCKCPILPCQACGTCFTTP